MREAIKTADMDEEPWGRRGKESYESPLTSQGRIHEKGSWEWTVLGDQWTSWARPEGQKAGLGKGRDEEVSAEIPSQ